MTASELQAIILTMLEGVAEGPAPELRAHMTASNEAIAGGIKMAKVIHMMVSAIDTNV